MPLNPVQVENPYGLPPIEGVSFTDEERRRLGMRTESAPPQAQTTEDRQLEMMRSISQAASQPGADQAALSRALSASATAVPMSEWKAPPEPLPLNKRELVREQLGAYHRQIRALETFASDPRNPASQEEVAKIRDQIESEFQRSLANATLPSPVSMYEQLVEDENPEVARAKHKDTLAKIPGFKSEWSSFVSFDPETNEPVYPKWMEKPMEAAMSKAMGVGEDESESKIVEAANKFVMDQLDSQKPDKKDYEGDIEGFDAAMAAWNNKKRAQFLRANPEAAKHLPTFAEEQGFTQPAAPVAPVGGVAEIRTLEEAQAHLVSDEPQEAVVVGPDGARYQFLPNGKLTMISGPAQ
jgi:hypothetical protein